MLRKFAPLGFHVCRHLELSAQVSVHYSSAHSVLPPALSSFQDVAYWKDTQYSWPICYPCSLHWITTFTFRVCRRTRKRKCLIFLMATCVSSLFTCVLISGMAFRRRHRLSVTVLILPCSR